jgi:hypothetical protein
VCQRNGTGCQKISTNYHYSGAVHHDSDADAKFLAQVTMFLVQVTMFLAQVRKKGGNLRRGKKRSG